MIMKLYILKHTGKIGYDEYTLKIVRAKNAKKARDEASIIYADEGDIWRDTKLVSCKQLKIDGKPGIIMSDFNAG